MKSTQGHISFLDHIRAIAILWVFLFHSLDASFRADHFLFKGWFRDFSAGPIPFFLAPFTFGYLGVALFFVVSGFCIHLSHQKSRSKSWWVFVQRRFFRIYPPYLVALIFFCFFFLPTRLDFSGDFATSSYQFLTHIFLIYNFDRTTYFGVNPAFWSIAVEVQLYLLYPLLLWITRRWGWYRTLWITATIEVGMRVVMAAFHDSTIKLFLPGVPFLYWYSWTIGAALAEGYLKNEPLPFARVPLFLWPTLTAVACVFEPLYPFSFMFAALSTACCISRLLSRTGEPLPIPKPVHYVSEYLRFIGVISYSIYLIHQPLLDATMKLLRRLPPNHSLSGSQLYAMSIVTWMLITVLAYAVYRLIELPSIALGKAFSKEKRPETTTMIPNDFSAFPRP